MALEIIEYVKDKVYPQNYDYLFNNSKEFFELTYGMTPKIEGKWSISINRPTFDDIEDLLRKYSDEWNIDIKIYVRKDVLIVIKENFPRTETQKLTAWQQYLRLLSEFPKNIERKASSELYRRSQGNIDTLRKNLQSLSKLPTDTITIKDVRSEIMNVPDVYYPRDLLLTLLLKGSRAVPRKKSRYSQYLYKHPLAVADEVVNQYGEEIVFYSIRKTLRRLMKAKIESLNGRECEFKDLVGLVSVYEVLRLYVLWETSSAKQLYSIILYITGGNKNVDFFRETLLPDSV